MRDGKPKPQNTEFRFSKEVRGKAKINDNPIVADLDMLQKKHSNVLKTKGAVARLILAIKDDPTHFLDGSNPQNALLLKKLKDGKTGMIGVRREDTPENLIVHALKSSNKKEIERLVRRQMGRASLPTTLKNETGTGAKAHSSASGDIISQNSAKDELKTLSKEYDVEQFLKDREGILAKDARYGKTRFSEARVEDNGGVGGWEYKRTPAGYDKNYKADFLITKADVVKIRGGKIDEQGSKLEQSEAKQEVVKGEGWTMKEGKLTYLDQVKFELDDWLKAQTGIDDVITASLAWLKSEHPEMHNSKRAVKELIEYVLDRPSVAKSGKSENSVYLGKADDSKMKDIVIDKGDKKIIHANRRKMTSEEKEAKRASEDALHSHTDTKPAGALTLGQDARLARFNDSIISQNSAKDETAIKTHVNPHVGTGLAGGTLNAKDENGNFDAEKFAKGFIYGLFGSKVTAEQGSKLEQAEAKQEVVKGEAKNQQFNNTNVDYTLAVKNIVERKELALRLDPKADILSVVKDFSKPIKTPIFTSKISVDKMLNHLADKIDGDRRLEYINLVKPTLEKPLFITQESINGAQRFRFFKTFIDEKDKVVKFLNVVEDKNGELIEITATPIKNTDLKNLLKGKVIWGGDTLSDLSTPQTAKQGSEADKAIISQNSAKEARYRKTRFSEARVEDNGGVGGWEYKRTPAGYDKNYKADFLITKADVAK